MPKAIWVGSTSSIYTQSKYYSKTNANFCFFISLISNVFTLVKCTKLRSCTFNASQFIKEDKLYLPLLRCFQCVSIFSHLHIISLYVCMHKRVLTAKQHTPIQTTILWIIWKKRKTFQSTKSLPISSGVSVAVKGCISYLYIFWILLNGFSIQETVYLSLLYFNETRQRKNYHI